MNELRPYQREISAGIDLLSLAVALARQMLAETNRPTKERIHIFWAAAKSARNLGSGDVVCDAFFALAVEVGLIDQTGHWTGTDVRESCRRFGRKDVLHVISWAQRGWNPFETGSLQ